MEGGLGESKVHAPRRGAHDALALVLALDRVKLEIEVLPNVAHERQDLAHAVEHGTDGREEVDDRVGDGVGLL